jgi:hypothetical protein
MSMPETFTLMIVALFTDFCVIMSPPPPFSRTMSPPVTPPAVDLRRRERQRAHYFAGRHNGVCLPTPCRTPV